VNVELIIPEHSKDRSGPAGRKAPHVNRKKQMNETKKGDGHDQNEVPENAASRLGSVKKEPKTSKQFGLLLGGFLVRCTYFH